ELRRADLGPRDEGGIARERVAPQEMGPGDATSVRRATQKPHQDVARCPPTRPRAPAMRPAMVPGRLGAPFCCAHRRRRRGDRTMMPIRIFFSDAGLLAYDSAN